MGKSPERSLKKLKRKLEKLERKIKEKTRSRHSTRSPERRRSRTRSRSCIRTLDPAEDCQYPDQDPEKENTPIDLTSEDTAATTADVDSDVLALLGNYPQEKTYGPDLLPSIVMRWEAIIKKGLDKDEKKELIKKYPPPSNCKIITAPKLNPEAQAAAGENVIKRDKAIEAKQYQVSCAISALGAALNNLCKSAVGNKESIALVSDAARLLCDYHHSESITRKNFILTGLEKSIKENIKDTSIDEWLFGTDFADKLKASKAIKRSGQELKSKQYQTQNKNFQSHSHLNFRGTTNNFYKPRAPKNQTKGPKQYNNQMKTSQSVHTQQTSFRSRQQQLNQHRRR